MSFLETLQFFGVIAGALLITYPLVCLIGRIPLAEWRIEDE